MRLATLRLCLVASAVTAAPGVASAAGPGRSPEGTIAAPKADSRRPVPEYAPIQAILVSEDLFNFNYHASELAQAIVAAGAEVWIAAPVGESLGKVKEVLRKGGVSKRVLARTAVLTLPHDNIWLRDFGPVAIAVESPAGPNLHFGDLRYDDGSPVSDKLPIALGAELKIPVEPIDVFMDGGNLLVAGDLCLTSGPVSGEGSRELEPGTAAFKTRYAASLGCREVLVLKDPPHAHLDMWAKVVDDRRVLVNEVTEKTLSVARKTGTLAEAQALKASLDRMARELGEHLQVIRIPMPLPYRGGFRTYTNSILVNGHAIIPSFRRFGWNYDQYPDAALTTYYEREAVKVYAGVGQKPQFINADGMIFNGGAFHCVTISIPKLVSHPSKLN